MNINQNPSPKVDAPNKMPLVMLVDDSEIDNYVNNKIIQRYEFSDRVLTFENSTAAFNFLKESVDKGDELPSVIFLDLTMPIMDGKMFVEKMEEFPQIKDSCKVIILSNSANPSLHAEMLNKNTVYAFFSKPLIKDNLDHVSLILKTNQKFKPAHILPHIEKNEIFTVPSHKEQTVKAPWFSFLNIFESSMPKPIAK